MEGKQTVSSFSSFRGLLVSSGHVPKSFKLSSFVSQRPMTITRVSWCYIFPTFLSDRSLHKLQQYLLCNSGHSASYAKQTILQPGVRGSDRASVVTCKSRHSRLFIQLRLPLPTSSASSRRHQAALGDLPETPRSTERPPGDTKEHRESP